MSNPVSSLSSYAAAIALLIASAPGALHAQTQANCTFTFFDPPANYIYGFYPNGINNFNTVVGGVFGPFQDTEKAFIHYSGGSLSLFGFPQAHWTVLNRRSSSGLSVGAYGSAISSVPPGTGSNGLMFRLHPHTRP